MQVVHANRHCPRQNIHCPLLSSRTTRRALLPNFLRSLWWQRAANSFMRTVPRLRVARTCSPTSHLTRSVNTNNLCIYNRRGSETRALVAVLQLTRRHPRQSSPRTRPPLTRHKKNMKLQSLLARTTNRSPVKLHFSFAFLKWHLSMLHARMHAERH